MYNDFDSSIDDLQNGKDEHVTADKNLETFKILNNLSHTYILDLVKLLFQIPKFCRNNESYGRKYFRLIPPTSRVFSKLDSGLVLTSMSLKTDLDFRWHIM